MDSLQRRGLKELQDESSGELLHLSHPDERRVQGVGLLWRCRCRCASHGDYNVAAKTERRLLDQDRETLEGMVGSREAQERRPGGGNGVATAEPDVRVFQGSRVSL